MVMNFEKPTAKKIEDEHPHVLAGKKVENLKKAIEELGFKVKETEEGIEITE